MSPRLIASAALAAILLAGAAPPPLPLTSGPPVGAKNDRSGFLPQYVAGAFAGDHRCPV
jgi:hypothetical protein